MRDTRNKKGFTLVELLVALMVTAIISAAVATLAFALGTANDATSNTGEKQAQLRQSTIRICELLKHSKLICMSLDNELVIWRADDNGNDEINITELVYIESGPERNYLRLCEFDSSTNPVIQLGWIEALITEWWLNYASDERHTLLIPSCSDVRFLPDAEPPSTRLVTVSFELTENGVANQYQVTAALRGRAGHLLDASGNIVSDDD